MSLLTERQQGITRRGALGLVLASAATPGLSRAGVASGSSLLRYEVAYSAGAAPGDRLPLVLALHWFGASPSGMLGWLKDLKVKARIVAPSGPEKLDSGQAWWPEKVSPQQETEQIQARTNELAQLIGSLTSRFPTAGKPLALGLSHGGDLAFALAKLHPDKIGSAITIGARLLDLPAGAAPLLARLDVFQGETDEIVPPAGVIRAVEKLRRQGGRVQLRLVPGTGHALPENLRADVRDLIEDRLIRDAR